MILKIKLMFQFFFIFTNWSSLHRLSADQAYNSHELL